MIYYIFYDFGSSPIPITIGISPFQGGQKRKRFIIRKSPSLDKEKDFDGC